MEDGRGCMLAKYKLWTGCIIGYERMQYIDAFGRGLKYCGALDILDKVGIEDSEQWAKIGGIVTPNLFKSLFVWEAEDEDHINEDMKEEIREIFEQWIKSADLKTTLSWLHEQCTGLARSTGRTIRVKTSGAQGMFAFKTCYPTFIINRLAFLNPAASNGADHQWCPNP